MKKIASKHKGFSFLELMITITIAGIMTTVIMVSMNNQREKTIVEEAAREVAAVIRETQNYALTGKGLTATSSVCAYIFSWTGGSNYGITGCRTQSYTLKNGVTFSSGGNIFFSVPLAETSAADIRLNKGSSSYHVCVYTSGLVSEKLDGC